MSFFELLKTKPHILFDSGEFRLENPSTELSSQINLKENSLSIKACEIISEPINIFFMPSEVAKKAFNLSICLENLSSCELRIFDLTENNNLISINLQKESSLKVFMLCDSTKTLKNSSDFSSSSKTSITCEKSSRLSFYTFCFGDSIQERKINVELTGEHAECDFKWLSVPSKNGKVSNQIELKHLASNCKSSQLNKSLLREKSVCEFSGEITVGDSITGTEASQLSRALLLSHDAKMHNRPHLKISSEDVKCSHGVSIGHLDENELFYLISRGISQDEAKKLLVKGFCQEIISKDVLLFPLLNQLCEDR